MVILTHKRWSPETLEIVIPVSTNEELWSVYHSMVDAVEQADLNWHSRWRENLLAAQQAGRYTPAKQHPNICHIHRPKRKAIIEYWPPGKSATKDWSHGPPSKRVTIIKERDRPTGMNRRFALLEGQLSADYIVVEGCIIRT